MCVRESECVVVVSVSVWECLSLGVWVCMDVCDVGVCVCACLCVAGRVGWWVGV